MRNIQIVLIEELVIVVALNVEGVDSHSALLVASNKTKYN